MDRILILLSIIVFSIHADDFACKNAKYTIEINECKMAEVKKAEILLEKYILASKKQYKDDQEVVVLIDKSQEQWLRYRSSHCKSIYQVWIDGTIRDLMYGQCMLDVTKRRTHEIWEAYLTFMDSTPPVLKEPN